MKNSFFSRFTPKEPKFFPLLKQLSDVLSDSAAVLVESLQHDLPAERADTTNESRTWNVKVIN